MQYHMPPIKGFVENSSSDWPGQTCAVVSLPYCNLRCPYCHSHELVLKPDTFETLHLEAILRRMEAHSNRIHGICITGGEPTIHRDLASLLRASHEAGFKTKLDTNGTQPEILEDLIAENLVDFVAMDVKAPLDDHTYSRCVGVFMPVDIIRKSMSVIMTAGIPSTFRCTVVPSLIGESEVYRLATDVKDLVMQVHIGSHRVPYLALQNFDPADPMDPDLKKTEPFSKQTLARMQDAVDGILGTDNPGGMST